MDFEVWKTEFGMAENRVYHYSIRGVGKEIPVILDHYQFARLFPEINLDSIASAPGSTILEINAAIARNE